MAAMPVVPAVQIALLLTALAIALPLLRATRDARRTRRRLERARSASGEVVAVEDVGGSPVPTVRYHVGDERHETRPRTPRPAARYLVGQPVDVRYDPQEPAWMTVEAVQGDARVPRPPRAVATAAVMTALVGAALVLQMLR